MRTAKFVTISLPAEQLKTAERIAENRTMSELFREALRRYQQPQEDWRPSASALAQFKELVRLIRDDAKTTGLDKMTKAEIHAEVEAARKETRTKARRNRNRSGK